jgi:hypothetical protein
MTTEFLKGALKGYDAHFKPSPKPGYLHASWLATDEVADPLSWRLYVQVDKTVYDSMVAALTKPNARIRALAKLYEFAVPINVSHELASELLKNSHVRVAIHAGLHPQVASGTLLIQWFNATGNMVADVSYSDWANSNLDKAPKNFGIPLKAARDNKTNRDSRLLVVIQPPPCEDGCCF